MERLSRKSKSTKKSGNIWRPVFYCLVSLLCLAPLADIVLAQDKYPTKPITFVVGFAPGGSSEVAGRALTNSASKFLSQPINLITKPGGGSAIALTWLKNEKPDGYTIGLLSAGGVAAPHFRKLEYDPARDFTTIMQYSSVRLGLAVRSDSPWQTLEQFIAYARANPEAVRYSTAGPNSSSHMVMYQLATLANVKFKHIPFEGSSPAVTALLGGHVEAIAEDTVWKPHVLSGRLRLLAVFGEKRLGFAPSVPTLKEAGYDIFSPNMVMIVGPKGLPSDVVETLHGAFKKALEDPNVLSVLEKLELTVIYRNPQDTAAALAEFNKQVEAIARKIAPAKQ